MIESVIARLEAMPKQGESYDHKGRHGWANPIRQDTGPLLEAITLSTRPQRVLEIGTAYGLSACYIGRRLPSEAAMVSLEWDETRAAEAQKAFDEANLPIIVMHGDAMETIKGLALLKAFNLVFLDANKDGYLEQFLLLKKLNLLAPGCVIVADNVIDRQKECQNFLDEMQNYPHVILQTECGLLVATV